MDKIVIEIETGNAAFAENWQAETARILRGLCERLDSGAVEAVGTHDLYDTNGNRCGYADVVETQSLFKVGGICPACADGTLELYSTDRDGNRRVICDTCGHENYED